jgi:hypothetical protein
VLLRFKYTLYYRSCVDVIETYHCYLPFEIIDKKRSDGFGATGRERETNA